MTDQRQVVGALLERPSATRAAEAKRSLPPEQLLSRLPSPRELTRDENGDRYRRWLTHASALVFRCECARPGCRLQLPLALERHRRRSDRFIVGVAHGHGDTVVGVADHFLIVEENRGEQRPVQR